CNTGDLVWRAGRGKDSRPNMPRHLNPSGTHTAGTSVDQDGLAGRQLPQGEERLIGRKEHFGYCCSLDKTPASRDRHGPAITDSRTSGIAAASDQPEPPIPTTKPLCGGAHCCHLTGQVQTENGRLTRWRWILSAPLQGIGTIESRGPDLDQQLLGTRCRIR